MKSMLILLLLLPAAIVAQVNLNNGLVAYYPFNGNANDESGNNHNPSTIKASFVPDRFNKPNSACSFNGKNNFIRIPDHSSLHFRNGFSISAWVMVKGFYEGTCHGNRIIMKGYSDDENGNYTLTFDDNHYTNGSNCSVDAPDKQHQSFYGALATPVTNDFVIPGKWYLLTYTYDGYTASLYVDCKLQAKGTKKNYTFSNNEDLFFGKLDNYQYPYWFNGLLDEVRIYNRPLSKEEILILCDKSKIPADPALLCNGENRVAAKFEYTIKDCNTLTFSLTAAKTKNLKTIRWSFGDGASSDKLSPVHTYKKYGNYKVRAIVTSKMGCIDTFTKQIQLQELKADFTFSEQGLPGEIQFRVTNNKASYSWNFGDETSVTGESAVTHQYKESSRYTTKLFAKNNAGCTDTVTKEVMIALPEVITMSTTEKDTLTNIAVPENRILEQRKKDVIKTILVENDSITLALYDNGIIDGDSITLLFNNTIILSHQLLKSKPLYLRLKIDPDKSSNDLVMYAENLGSIPPNTALMIITDGNNRYDVNVSSTRFSNGVISFTPKR